MTIKNLPTIQELNAKLEYTADTGEINRINPNAVKGRILGSAIIKRPNGQPRVYVLGQMYTASKMAWYLHTRVYPQGTIKHKNGDKADIRFENLYINKSVVTKLKRDRTKKESLKMFSVAKDMGMAATIKNFPDYAIFTDGKILHLTRGIFLDDKMEHRSLYKRHGLTKDGIHYVESLHRLLAEAFIPNPNNFPFVLHADDNPKNNTLYNLRWGTPQDNVDDRELNRDQTAKRRNNRLSEEKKAEVLADLLAGMSVLAACEKFNVCSATIYKIKKIGA